jgi:hypothetical protein
MMLRPVGPSLLSTTRTQLVACSRLVVGVEPGGMGLGVGVGTLLSPEASAVGLVSLGPSGPVRRCGGGLARVGVFLVNWIVDASIFATACRHPGRSREGGVGVDAVAMF